MIDPQKIRPPHVAAVFLTLILILNFLLSPPRVISQQYWGVGIIVLVAGFMLMGWARQLFGKYKTPVRHSEKPTRHVTEGPFRFSRNPMYVGGIIMFVGLAIAVGTWPFFLFPLFMAMILNSIYIPWEEQMMIDLFGDEFKQYMKKIRRWI